MSPLGALLGETPKLDAASLLSRAEALVGKKLLELEQEIVALDDKSRVLTKAGAAYVIERYFGIKANSFALPDFADLGIELKTVPLMERAGMLTVKEPLSLNMINYFEEAKCDDITESSLYKKNKEILFICYLHKERRRSEYVVMYSFLWKMDEQVLAELRPDFDWIIKKIRAGEATGLHQEFTQYLCTCPKHNGKFKDPLEMTSKVKQPFSQEWAEKKAYRLKNCYMSLVISTRLGVPLEYNGRGSSKVWWRPPKGPTVARV